MVKVTEEEISREQRAFPGLGKMQAYYRIQGRKEWLAKQRKKRF